MTGPAMPAKPNELLQLKRLRNDFAIRRMVAHLEIASLTIANNLLTM
jgi:hypothetical protein